MATDLGVESFLGDAEVDELGNQDARDKLALSTRYLANWYKATSSSQNQGVWWGKIDTLRGHVETLYSTLLTDDNPFLSPQEKTDYNAASGEWADLWRQLTLSTDTIDTSLLSQAADFISTAAKMPATVIPDLFEQLGKLLNDSFGKFLAQAWPVVTIVVIGGVVYLFHKPISNLAGKVGT